MTRDRLILAVLAGGFLIVSIETRFEHQRAVRETLVAWIPTIAAGVALLTGGYLLLSSKPSRWLAGLVFALVAAAGLVGLYFHTELKPSAFAALFGTAPTQTEKESERDEEFERSEKKESKPPALAPLSLSGLGMIGFLLAFPPRRTESERETSVPA